MNPTPDPIDRTCDQTAFVSPVPDDHDFFQHLDIFIQNHLHSRCSRDIGGPVTDERDFEYGTYRHVQGIMAFQVCDGRLLRPGCNHARPDDGRAVLIDHHAPNWSYAA